MARGQRITGLDEGKPGDACGRIRRLPLAALLAAVLAGCAPDAEAQELTFRPPPADPVADGAVRIREDSLPYLRVEEVGGEPVGAFVRAPGRVAFREGAVSEVGAPVDGRVTALHARVGERVETGAPLVSIASLSAARMRGELARARVMVRAARAEVARQERMAQNGVGIDIERERATAELARAQATLAALRATTASIGHGDATSVTVRAPIAGTVLARRASVGASVKAGDEPLLVIGEPGTVWVLARVFERELPLVRVGARAHVEVASMQKPVDARVEAIAGAVDPSTRRGAAYLVFDDEEVARRLRAGMYARAEIEVGKAGVGVPTSAVLIEEDGRTVVYVERPEDERTFAPRDVHVGAPVNGRVPVLEGLDRGERIVTDGALLLDARAELLR